MRCVLTCMMIGFVWLCATQAPAQTPEFQNEIEKKPQQQRDDTKSRPSALRRAIEALLQHLFDGKGTLKIEIDGGDVPKVEKNQLEIIRDKPKVEELRPGGFRIEIQTDKPKRTGGSPKPGSVEAMRADALKNHPNIRVAEAKLRLAEAELERTRAHVLAELDAALADLERNKASLTLAKVQFDRATRLFQVNAISREEFDAASAALERAQGDLLAAETRINALTGRPSGANKSKQ